MIINRHYIFLASRRVVNTCSNCRCSKLGRCK